MLTYHQLGFKAFIWGHYSKQIRRYQAIIWANAVLLSIGPFGTNFSQGVFTIQIFSLKKMRLKISSGKCQPFCLSLNMLTHCIDPFPWRTMWWNNKGLNLSNVYLNLDHAGTMWWGENEKLLSHGFWVSVEESWSYMEMHGSTYLCFSKKRSPWDLNDSELSDAYGSWQQISMTF